MKRTIPGTPAILIFLCSVIIGSFWSCMGAKPDREDTGAPAVSAGTAETSSPLTTPPSDATPAQTPHWQLAEQQLAIQLDQRALAMGVKGPRVYTIRGRVVDNRLVLSSENLAVYESAATEDEVVAALKKMFGGGPAPGVVVVLRSGEFTQEATADSDGGFTFSGVPDGPCELSIKGDSAAAPAKQAMSRAQVVIGGVTLQLRNDWVTVSGHVRDAAGRGVAGAKVNGVHVVLPEAGSERQWYRFGEEYSTVTDATGYYEFERLEPESPFKIVRSMGRYSELRSLEIRGAADGLKSGIVRVPLVSEDLVEIARSFREAANRLTLRNGGTLPKNLKDPSPVTSSKGNRIMNVDIVLDPASTN